MAVEKLPSKHKQNARVLSFCVATSEEHGALKKSPNPVDKHVGSRVRMQRMLAGLSQERLGDAIGLTFQQVQKYEKGLNRIGASRLQQIAGVLNVSPAFFFENMTANQEPGTDGLKEDTSSFVVDFLSTSEGLLLNRNFVRIRDPKIRRRVIELVASLADQDSGTERPD